MPKSAEEKVTYDYNIYKITDGKAEDLCSYLEERKYEEIPLKQDLIKEPNGFAFKLLFCDKDNKKGSPWVSLLSSCSEWDLSQNLKIYGAALICQSKEACYAISYGNAHFYMNDYCDYSFGIRVAERLIDLNSVKAQQNVSHGGKLSKTHIDYLSNTTLSYRGGEIPTYIKGSSINEELWGKTIQCGTSAQFKWEEKPLEIGKKLSLLSQACKTESNISLPRLIALDSENDADKIDELFASLANAIEKYDNSAPKTALINVPSFYLIGTKLIQNDSIRFKMSCNRKNKQYDGELSIDAIKKFLQEKEIEIKDAIRSIKLSVEYGNDLWTPYKPIIEYLEFVTEDNFCLRNGKWCIFNNAYIEQVFRDVDKVLFNNHTGDSWKFNKADICEYAKQQNIYNNTARQPYETYYNHKLANLLNGKLIHPDTVPVDEKANHRYRYEVCDILVGTEMYFVKIGSPTNFAYAVDQAMLTLSIIQNGFGIIDLPNEEKAEPTVFHLVLVCDDRKTVISNWRDVYSINFLIHLSELKQNLNNMNISLIVDFVYN